MTYVDTAAPTRTWIAKGAYLRSSHIGASWLIDLEPDDWTPAADQVIASRWNTGQDSYAIVLATDGIDFTWVDNEGTQRTHTFTLPSPTGRQTLYLEYTPDQRTVKCWIRAGGALMRGGFTAMGVAKSTDARAFAIRASTSPLYLGTTDADAPDLWTRFAGLIYGFEHRQNDTLVTRWDRTELNATTQTFNDEQAFSWTVAGTADVAETAGLFTLLPVVDTLAVGRVPPTRVSVTYSTWTDALGTAELTPSVSWLAGDRIVVAGATENQPRTLALPTATGLTFSAVTSHVAGGTNTYIWAATAAGNGSSVISSAVDATGAMRGLAVYVYRGSDGIGASGSSRPGATWTRSLARGQDRSAVVEIAADWNAVNDITVSPTPTTGGTVGRIERTAAATFFTADWTDEGTAGTTAYGITGYTATSDWSMSTVEILGTAGGGGGAVDFAGVVEAIGEMAGALATDRPLAVAVEAIGETVGVLARERPIAAVVEAVGELAGVLARERPMATVVEAVGELAGVLTETRPLAGAVEGVATINGEIVRAIDLVVAVEAVGQIAGDLTIAGQVTYTAAVEAIGELTGDIVRVRDLAGASEAVGEVAGAINIAGLVTFTGAVEGVQDTVGALSVAKTFTGVVEAVSTVSGDLNRARVLAAVIEAVSTIIGELNTGLVVPPSGAPWELTFVSPTQKVTVNDPLKVLVFSSTQQIVVLMDRPKTMALADNDHRVTLRDPSQTVVL